VLTVAVKELLKRNKFFVAAVRAARGSMRSNEEIVEEIPIFAPNSAGSMNARAALALQAAQQTFPFLVDLVTATKGSPAQPRPIATVFPESAQAADTIELGALFDRYGSDKSSFHDYHQLYAPMLACRRQEPFRLLEIGIGSNNANVVSNMGVTGKPGASLRAFRDFLPYGEIFGADIDRQILFQETRINTAFVDQTRPETFWDLTHSFGVDFDLIIDDGLHSPNANIATMLFAFRALKSGGTFVVEDIAEKSIPVWQSIQAILPASYASTLIDAKNGLLFMVTRP
jgi:hypothetical protein